MVNNGDTIYVLFFKNLEGVLSHMRKQAEIIRPKFETVLNVLKSELSGTGIANWNTPKGGYFVSAELMEGTAKRTVVLCKEAEVLRQLAQYASYLPALLQKIAAVHLNFT